MTPREFYAIDWVSDSIIHQCHRKYVTLRYKMADGECPLRRYYTESELRDIHSRKDRLFGAENEGKFFFEIQGAGNIHNPLDLHYHAARGLMEVIPEVSEINDLERTDTIIVDLDPKDPQKFGMDHLKWSTNAVYSMIAAAGGPVDGNFKIEATKFRFSGNRSFHIYMRLQKRYPFVEIRKALKASLEPLTNQYPFLRYQNMKTTKAGPPPSDFILIDIGAMSRHRCVRSLHSLHYKTGLVCVPVTDINGFEIGMSKVEHVIANGPVREVF